MMMKIACIPNLVGGHLGGWRHKDAFDQPVMNLEAFIEMSQIAERGKFDCVFLADGNGVRDMHMPALFAANHPSARPSFFEPTTLLSAVSMVTKKIGVVATATSTFEEPYSVARRFASMDHISKGRAGWNLVTASNAGDALNFGRPEQAREDRYARAQEFYEVVAKLWDSWAPDAFPQNKETGQYLDPARVRHIDHKGTHFSVKGPLNISRTPQGRPVVFMAGQSEPGMELAARYADGLFGAGTTSGLHRCLCQHQEAHGALRPPARGTEDPARRQHLCRPHDSRGRRILRRAAVADLAGAGCALPLEDAGARSRQPAARWPAARRPARGDLGGSSLRRYILDMARRDKLTIRQTYERTLPALGGPVFKGTATQVADEMEDWWRSKACDGFTLLQPVQPRGLTDFVDLVVPELQRRGIFRKEYESSTLRGHLGLAEAPSAWNTTVAERGAA